MSEARLTQLYAEAGRAKAEEARVGGAGSPEAARWRQRYRAIVDEITELNLVRKARERFRAQQDEALRR